MFIKRFGATKRLYICRENALRCVIRLRSPSKSPPTARAFRLPLMAKPSAKRLRMTASASSHGQMCRLTLARTRSYSPAQRTERPIQTQSCGRAQRARTPIFPRLSSRWTRPKRPLFFALPLQPTRWRITSKRTMKKPCFRFCPPIKRRL